ncbi:MAG: Cell division protein FtsA [Syntrophomonadaceae bacterium]|nr:Cell division protein FtsA [Bacillota bacterium]
MDEEEKEGVAVVDIGSHTIEIAIFKDKILRAVQVLPIGGQTITDDIAKGCNISKENAENLKVKRGSAIERDEDVNTHIKIPGLKAKPTVTISKYALAQIIRARLEEFAEMVLSVLMENGVDYSLTYGIVLTGGVANTPLIDELFEEVTGVAVRIGYPSEKVGNLKFEQMKNPAYSVAVGLALSGFQYLDERDNKYASDVDQFNARMNQLTSNSNVNAPVIEKAADTVAPVKPEPSPKHWSKLFANKLTELVGVSSPNDDYTS